MGGGEVYIMFLWGNPRERETIWKTQAYMGGTCYNGSSEGGLEA
jgi:hypothetical protein